MNKIIGLSGLATSGKDFFYDMLSKEVSCRRFSLADELKRTLRGEIIKEHNIDILDCTAKEKEKARPILVDYGKEKRLKSKGRFWIEKLNKIVREAKTKEDQLTVITDIRYNIYPNDEVEWLKHELGGILVYIKKYKLSHNNKGISRSYIDPPNEEEKINNPLVSRAADYVVDWPHVNSDNLEEVRIKLRPHIIKFLNWYGDKCKRKT